MIRVNESEFSRLREYLQATCGIDVPHEKRYLFETRLSNLLQELNMKSFSQLYLSLTRTRDRQLRARLVEAMTTNETAFFRDGHPFQTIETEVLPHLATRARAAMAGGHRPNVRMLCAGCSTGEEPYTLAMLVHNWIPSQNTLQNHDVRVVGVDISPTILQKARRGIYDPADVARAVGHALQTKYFESVEQGLRVCIEIRDMVSFCEVNLAEPFDFLGAMDLILCRNVLIYFSTDLKRQILERFARMLDRGGILMLGASETLFGLSSAFRPVHSGRTTYFVRE